MFGLNDSSISAISTIVVAVITFIVTPFITKYVDKMFLKSNNRTDEIANALDIAKIISDKLQSIKDELGVDRVLLSQFHNGGNFIHSGQGIKKFSIFYETLKFGIESIKLHYQNIPISLFHKYIVNIQQSRWVKINFNEHNSETYDIDTIGEYHGIKTRYAFAIFTLDDKFAGFLELDFIDDMKNLNDKQITKLQQEAGAIGGILINTINKK